MNPYLDDPLYRELIPVRPSKPVPVEDTTPGWVRLKALARALDEVPARAAEAS